MIRVSSMAGRLRLVSRRRPATIAGLPLLALLVVLPAVAALADGMPALADPAHPATGVEREWMRVLLDGRRVGHLEIERRADADTIETIESMRLVLERDGSAVPLETRTVSLESARGEPLAFRSESRLSGTTQVVEGRVIDGTHAEVTLISAGGRETRRIEWQPGAVLVEGAERIARAESLATGARWRHIGFDAGSLLFVPVESEVIGRETIMLEGERRMLTRIRQRATLPGTELVVDGWHADDHSLRRALMPMFGLELELVACATDCSAEPIQSVDLFERTLVASPRPLPAGERRRPQTHRVRVPDGAGRPAASAGQRVEPAADGFRVTVDPVTWAGGGPPPDDADLAPNRWLEADDPAIVAAARGAIGEARDPVARMRRLTAFVRSHIEQKSLDVGYASARETLDARAGDCTEHALLLAALARSTGIPARVVSGLAYAPRWAGRDHVFVPHAWVEAWTGDRWEAFDAAIPEGFGSGHLALAVGDGEPAGFFAAVGLLGNLAIDAIDRESRADR
jgi:hypothetical protein